MAGAFRYYIVNKPLPAARISVDNVRGWEKNEHLTEKRSFEGKCEILRIISQPWTLSADIPASREGVYLFYNPAINFFAIKPRVNMVKKPVVIWWRMCAWLTWGSKSKFVGLTNFISTVIGRNLTSCQISKTYRRGRGLLRDNCPRDINSQ